MTAHTAQTTKYPQIVTHRMIDEAIVVAITISGLDGYGGMRSIDGTPGLVGLVQEYIDTARETRDCGMIVYENSGTYWIGY